MADITNVINYKRIVVPKRHFDESEDERFNGFESDSSDGYAASTKTAKRCKTLSVTSEEMQRRPTRRPDPTVTNRNAIMARENRRKQKERMERLEAENEKLIAQNSHLSRAMAEKEKAMQHLKREYNYLKSVISNKTPIVQILNTIKAAKLPMSSSLNNYVIESPGKKSPASESTISVSSSSGYESPNLNDAKSSHEDDYEMNPNSLEAPSYFWSGLGDTNEILSEQPPNPELFDVEDMLVPEHSYSADIKSEEDPGVCVHISNQRVSIEFCGSCHANAADGWLEH